MLNEPQQQQHLQRTLWVFVLAFSRARLKSQPSERVWRRMPSEACPKAYFSIREKNIPKSVGAKTYPCFTLLTMLKGTEVEPLN